MSCWIISKHGYFKLFELFHSSSFLVKRHNFSKQTPFFPIQFFRIVPYYLSLSRDEEHFYFLDTEQTIRTIALQQNYFLYFFSKWHSLSMQIPFSLIQIHGVFHTTVCETKSMYQETLRHYLEVKHPLSSDFLQRRNSMLKVLLR